MSDTITNSRSRKLKGLYRLVDNRWLYVAYDSKYWGTHLRQYPDGVHSYVVLGLEISFPSWRTK